MVGSLGARYLPGFGFKPLQPVSSQAAYLPVWFVDAEVEAKVWVPHRQGAEPSQVCRDSVGYCVRGSNVTW